MGVRSDLAAALDAALPDSVQVVKTVRDLGELDPAVTGVVQLVRTQVAPAPETGSFLNTFDVWTVTPKTDSDLVDDDLDAALDALLEAMLPLGYLAWETAEREMHPDGYHAYKMNVTVKSDSVN